MNNIFYRSAVGRYQLGLQNMNHWIKNFNIKKLDQFAVDIRTISMVCSYVGKDIPPILAIEGYRYLQTIHYQSNLWKIQNKQDAFQFHYYRALKQAAPTLWHILKYFIPVSNCKSNQKLFIEESELVEHMKDLDFFHELIGATISCESCKNLVKHKIPNLKCQCSDTNSKIGKKIDGYSWIPLSESPNLLVWKQPQKYNPKVFAYKVFGMYEDVTPKDFLATQLDLEYRKTWDKNVIKLEVVEQDLLQHHDIIYWSIHWPMFFSNRDYCYARRQHLDEDSGNYVIISKAITNPKVPDRDGYVRVKKYWSIMHIRAVTGLNSPGVQFGLTYLDDPGTELPDWLSDWVARNEMPEFMNKMKIAAQVKGNANSSN